jgi:hypothetical protein
MIRFMVHIRFYKFNGVHIVTLFTIFKNVTSCTLLDTTKQNFDYKVGKRVLHDRKV